MPGNNPGYGGFWVRVLAVIIDAIIIGIIFSPILNAIFPTEEVPVNFHFLDQDYSGKYLYDPASNIRNVIAMIYSILMLHYYGTTLGKKLLGLKVITESGKKPELLNLIIRETIGKLLSAIVLGLGYLWVAFDPRKQGWHDKLAKTVVVYDK